MTTNVTDQQNQQKANTTEIRSLDEGSARQLGEWLVGQVWRTSGTQTPVPTLNTGHHIFLGKLCYDTVIQYIKSFNANDPNEGTES